ncbi:M42 family metallopeptidase [Alicyclobacillus ferrooxydans]|uniref:Peptidase M28 n=1 Tax=Alicyclobacillus ferrooxydans TaxID=471514 RepID=A0A0P9ENU8_9BACL|nr:M42 family metallopeptidase [Alicyclobacillus ferrooxydans]KPV45143.1 peptidase M28 [Alicyclobacillus ferrooxydans]
MSKSRVEIIKELCEAYGVSGQEAEVRKLYETYLAPVSEELEHDNFGGVVGKKTGDANGPRVLISGHLDEIGMMVTYITDEGFIYFQTVGGWWNQVMLAQRVVIQTRKGNITGIIGSKPPHVLPAEERKKTVPFTSMFIDIGVTSKAEAEEVGVRPGDPILPWSPFVQLANPKFYMGKALDNRLGCATALEVLRSLQGVSHPNILYAGATTQEEVGLRGAQTMVQHVKPDIAIALDVGIAGDTPEMKKSEALSKCGDGPILLLYDSSMIPNPKFRDFVMDTASDAGIPLQVEVVAGGGTDAGRFQTFGSGVPSVAIGYPTRYIHSHAAVYHQDDFDNGVALLTELVKRLDFATVRDIQAH